MNAYAYVAVDGAGKEQRGRLEAADEQEASRQLKDRGLFPTSVLTAGKPTAATPRPGARPKRASPGGWTQISFGPAKIKRKDLTTFTRQLATLLDAGLPLVRGLRTLERQTKDVGARRTIGAIADSVEGGQTFSDALAGQPRSFDRLYVNMIRAGEASGALEQVLTRLAEYMEKAARLKGKVKAALIYPVVVMCIAGAITAGLMIFIVPKFSRMFTEMLAGKPLPWLTRFVVGISDFMLERWWLGVLIIVGVVLLFRFVRWTSLGSYLLDLVAIKMPPFGDLVTKSSVARFCSTLSTLLQSGVAVLNALQIVRDTSGNQVMARAVQVVHDAVSEGEGMARPLESTQVFPVMVVSMIEVGEETGALPEMLQRVARVYEEEVDMAVEALTSLIEPVMIVVLGVIIGGIVLAMFMPLMVLITDLGGPS